MIIDSKFFDKIEINPEDIIYFEKGLLGFEDVKRYVLLNMDERGRFKCLQSVDRWEVAFIVINPWDAFPDYDIDIDDGELEAFNDKSTENFAVYSIVTIREKTMTANLIGPVLINVKTRQGKQVVLHHSPYTTKHMIKEFAEREK